MEPKLITLHRHIAESQRWHPEATGTFTRLLSDLSLAARVISREVNRAGLADIFGSAGDRNVSGDTVQKLDQYAQDAFVRAMQASGTLCAMASEELESVLEVPDAYPKGRYVLVFDPLDGSSNIEVNVSVGTVFGIFRRVTPDESLPGTLEDVLQPGRRLVAAGYILYGSSTMLVYTTGHGVNGFTLDPSLGEFLLSHPSVRIPERGSMYSVNEGNRAQWDPGTRRFIDWLKEPDAETGRPYSLRYVGTLVADVHRMLLRGGVFLYPSDRRDPARPKSKIRLVYEANPIAMLVEQAGGRASTGDARILDMQPTELHQKVPLVAGSRRDVETYEEFLAGKR